MKLVIVLIFFVTACKKKKADRVEESRDVVGSVSALTSYPGRNRVKLSWNAESEGVVDYRVYWNMGKDSLNVPLPSDNTNTIVNNLEEGYYTFSVAGLNSRGYAIIRSDVKERAYGSQYEDSLTNRPVKDMNYDESSKTLTINWESAASGTYQTEIKYMGESGQIYQLSLPAVSGSIALSDFKPDGVADYRSLYVPMPNAIDTFYTSYNSLNIPEPEPKVFWNGDASIGNGIWKVARNIDGMGTISIENDVTYGLTWKFDKPLGSHRTESHAASGFQAKEGDDIYIGWRSKLSMPANIQTNAVFQWKAYGADMQQNYPIVFKTSGTENLQLMHYAPGKIETRVWETPLKINAWNRFVLRLKISRDGEIGFMELWYNGIKQHLSGGKQRYYGRTLDADYCDPKWGVYGGDAQHISNYVSGLRIASTLELASPAKLPEPEPDPVPDPESDTADPPNLIARKIAAASSELSGAKAANAADDDLMSYWQPLSGDREDNNIWIQADMKEPFSFDHLHVFWNRSDIIEKYQLLYSNDGGEWHIACEKATAISSNERNNFPKVSARYVKLNISISKNANLTTGEWRIFEE